MASIQQTFNFQSLSQDNVGYVSSQPLIKSPLNYIGGKYKLLPQILPLFPSNINSFIDLFTGGCNVGINVNAKQITCNDNLLYLIDLYKIFQETPAEKVLEHIKQRISSFELSLENNFGYNNIRSFYNESRNPLDLIVLIAYSFNHQIRFNNKHKYNNPFGKNRSQFNARMESNLLQFINKLHISQIKFTNKDFNLFDFSTLDENDFVYCDPPYLITTGTYNDGKRGFKGWNTKEEKNLLNILDTLNKKNIQFALSNVLVHKGKQNDILQAWIEKNNYTTSYLNMCYANSNYQTRVKEKNASVEVLVTNYKPQKT